MYLPSQHNINYYVNDNPTVSDKEYDKLLRELETLEKKYPQFLMSDSPTQRVGGSPLEKFGNIEHSTPMLSLANAMNKEELQYIKENYFGGKNSLDLIFGMIEEVRRDLNERAETKQKDIEWK